MVRTANSMPDSSKVMVVTLRRRDRSLEDAVVVRLTTPANPLRLLSESVTVAGEPC